MLHPCHFSRSIVSLIFCVLYYRIIEWVNEYAICHLTENQSCILQREIGALLKLEVPDFVGQWAFDLFSFFWLATLLNKPGCLLTQPKCKDGLCCWTEQRAERTA